MKRFLFSAVAICMALFTSCSDSTTSAYSGGGGGSTTVGKKINRIYRSSEYQSWYSTNQGQSWTTISHEYGDNELRELWNWDGNKITSINYYYNGEISSRDVFSYNNSGKVSKISYYYRNDLEENFVFTYNGQLVSEFKYFDENDILDAAYEVIYTNNKPSRINCTYMSADSLNMSKHGKELLNKLFLINIDNRAPKGGSLPYHIITWSGNNMTKVANYHDNMLYSTHTYTHDSFSNPYYGGDVLMAYAFYNGDGMSQNNVVTAHHEYSDGETESYTYYYNYYENYPMEKSYSYEYASYDDDDWWYKSISRYKYSYEYLTE